MNVGIIPAAGRATRFDGIYKELLPVGGQSLLQRTYDALRPVCDVIILVTSSEKINLHKYLDVFLKVQNKKPGLLGAIEEGMQISAGRYYMAMPDTYFPKDIFLHMDNADLCVGWFKTSRPDLFGCIGRDGWIRDKVSLNPVPSAAWGVLSWSRKIRDSWLESKHDNFTQALNYAMVNGSKAFFGMDYYYDVGTMERYLELLNESL